jgi:hypothetical protein
MGLFNLVPNWDRPIHDALDAKMTECMKVGVAASRAKVHVVTGYLQSTIGGSYNKSTKTIQLHADAPYALIEEMRGPAHSYLAYGANAMAGFWGSPYKFELHFPNAAIERNKSADALVSREKSWRKNLRVSLRGKGKVKVISRRWHKRFDDDTPTDPTTPII